MYRQLLKNKLFGRFLAVAFSVGVVVIGFSAYTSQAISKKVSDHIYISPSQLQPSDIAYVPSTGTTESNLQHVTILLYDLFEAQLIQSVVCESEDLVAALGYLEVPAHHVRKQSTRTHQQVKEILDLIGQRPVLVIADQDILENELYVFSQNGIVAEGLELPGDGSDFNLPKYLSRLQLYIDARISKPNPLISNPRYTLDIQH